MHPLQPIDWKFRLLLIAGAYLGFAADASASIGLPRLVSDNMVLQRDAPLVLWGTASADERIIIRFRGGDYPTRANSQGRWQVTLAAQPAGGPDDMELRGNNTVTLKNILVGDVWLASGQSNMEFPLVAQGGFGGTIDAEQERQAAKYPRIRLFTVNRMTSLTPRTDVDSSGWVAATPATVGNFSAVAYLFGRDLHRRNKVPIGLIDATWGGTTVEPWISAKSLHAFPELEASARRAAALPATAMQDYDEYVETKRRWYQLHGNDDRGSVGGHDLWAAPTYDDSGWPKITQPQPWPRKAIQNFDGILWLRKTIDVRDNQAGKTIHVHLCNLQKADTTYFNGHPIGQTQRETAERDYEVAGEYVHAGRNVVAIRLQGEQAAGDGFVGLHGNASDMYVDLNGATVSLAGQWSYQPGADIAELPAPPPLAEFRKAVPQAPALLFNGMIAPLTSYPLKGVIWYQGESNVGQAAQYRALFPTMIEDWRAAWGYDMPFLFVQLAGFGRDRREPTESPWAELREAQSAALALPLTGMATAVDIGDENDIHPRNKQAVARRLALAAIKVAYQQPIVAGGPKYRSMEIAGDVIRIHYDDVGTGLKVNDSAGGLQGFAIAPEGGKFEWATARLDGADVVVSNPSIPHPVAVRYDWSNTPHGNLYNKEGLPALPFRTDGVQRR